ncbi:DUF6193 family natural product biosynthesis protein [Kitasatospora sp. McL0602]|uniref:DUF6193 family natural product biosynthesis protein n=1 Tax=Kitasatospora sp. McL0602 TaxID=3439530 RepID=UPI003F88F710
MNDVEVQWQTVRAMPESRVDHALVEAAHADPLLRTLYPLVSHGSLQFSRCTDFPWSQDLPSVFPDDGDRFRVLRLNTPGDPEIGRADTAAGAVELLVRNIPRGCGAAIVGGPELLSPLEG